MAAIQIEWTWRDMTTRLAQRLVTDLWEYRLAVFLTAGLVLSTAWIGFLLLQACPPSADPNPQVYTSGEVSLRRSPTVGVRGVTTDHSGRLCACEDVGSAAARRRPVVCLSGTESCQCSREGRVFLQGAAPTVNSKGAQSRVPMALSVVPLWALAMVLIAECRPAASQRKR